MPYGIAPPSLICGLKPTLLLLHVNVDYSSTCRKDVESAGLGLNLQNLQVQYEFLAECLFTVGLHANLPTA